MKTLLALLLLIPSLSFSDAYKSSGVTSLHSSYEMPSKVLLWIKKGDEIFPFDKTIDKFTKVEVNGVTGWMLSKFISGYDPEIAYKNSIVQNVEKINCNYHRKKDLVTLEIYNNNDKDIKSVTVNLTNKENDKVYKFKEDYSVDAYSSNTIWFWNVFFEPKKCKISDVEFKGWFN